ncbi:uncharacterized protein [Rutidosis leptorrhynchoides]|uniref:uncharacterized protein n=1 Tax=Rutidosis leptorrhynchoides TaxID=125765 RepID=UPI003A995FE6
MSGNKCATQGWIANVITDKLRSDGDVSVAELKRWLVKTYNVEVPYMRVFRGKEQAYTEMYGKWEDTFMQLDDFKVELLNRNPGSVVEIYFELKTDQKRFLHFFYFILCLSNGFLSGCRPYISLDACHLKGKFNGVLAADMGIDGNNSIFPVAYAVLKSENTKSWSWFLELLKKAIGVPDGLVISSDMQKGLEVAIMQVYPNLEHRECIRHLYSNFKKHFRGDFFSSKLWGYKCLMTIIVGNVNEVNKVLRSSDNRAEVKYKGRQWEVKGLPCKHAATFIGSIRDSNWDKYVDQFFTIEKFKEAYALEISPMPGKDQWVPQATHDNIYPPIIKRPPGRQKKRELYHLMSLKEDNDAHDVASICIVIRHAKIHRRKGMIHINH